MARRCHAGKAALVAGDLFEVGVLVGQQGHAHIGRTIEQGVDQDGGDEDLHARLQARKATRQARQCARHQVRREARWYHHGQRAAAWCGQPSRDIENALHTPPQGLDLHVQRLGFGGRHQPPFDACEQVEPQMALRLGERLAHRRLGNVEQLGRAAHATGEHDGTEHFHLTQVHWHNITDG